MNKLTFSLLTCVLFLLVALTACKNNHRCTDHAQLDQPRGPNAVLHLLLVSPSHWSVFEISEAPNPQGASYACTAYYNGQFNNDLAKATCSSFAAYAQAKSLPNLPAKEKRDGLELFGRETIHPLFTQQAKETVCKTDISTF
ncbi:MAG: hypothetical protein WC750_00110 [Patescibacteria group bacterium]|jgi:hypothetical protein